MCHKCGPKKKTKTKTKTQKKKTKQTKKPRKISFEAHLDEKNVLSTGGLALVPYVFPNPH